MSSTLKNNYISFQRIYNVYRYEKVDFLMYELQKWLQKWSSCSKSTKSAKIVFQTGSLLCVCCGVDDSFLGGGCLIFRWLIS